MYLLLVALVLVLLLPSSGGSDLLAALLPTITNLKKIETDKELRQQELQIEQEKVLPYTSYLGSQTEGQNITNQWLDDIFGAQLQNIESDTEMKQANSSFLLLSFFLKVFRGI